MNTASQNLPHHLDILHAKLTHPTDYELALNYFLEEFAGDLGFHAEGNEDDARHLQVVLTMIAAQMAGRNTSLQKFGAYYLPAHGFFHGRATLSDEPLLFFFFERANVGLAAYLPFGAEEKKVARFEMPAQAARNPKHN